VTVKDASDTRHYGSAARNEVVYGD
jgi:hypothetical protein